MVNELHAITARTVKLKHITHRALENCKLKDSLQSISFGCLGKKQRVIADRSLKIHLEDSRHEIEPILESGIGVRIIQFLALRGGPEPYIKNSQVHRLEACERVSNKHTLEEKAEIWKSAWAETVEILTESSNE